MRLPLTAYECPVDECDWTLKISDVDRSPRLRVRIDLPVAEALNQALNEAAAESIGHIDRKLRAHFESHDVLDWVRTVQRLEMDLAQVDCGIRPHVYENYRTEWRP